jgi:hypothetical protein
LPGTPGRGAAAAQKPRPYVGDGWQQVEMSLPVVNGNRRGRQSHQGDYKQSAAKCFGQTETFP